MNYFRFTWTSVMSRKNKMALPKGKNPWHIDLEFHNVCRGWTSRFYTCSLNGDIGPSYGPNLWYRMIHFTLYEDDLVDIVNMYLVGFFLRSYIYGSKRIFLDVIHFYYITIMIPPCGLNPWPRGHDLYNLGKEHYRENFYAFSFLKIFMGVDYF